MQSFTVETEHPFCYDSLDYQSPCGSKNDYHTNPRFIERSTSLFRYQCNVIDLGCANGTMIVDFNKAGHIGIGIDGSDYGVTNKTGGWGSHPDKFFNADISKPFKVFDGGFETRFDIITAWEVMEHIKEEDLPVLFNNVKNLMHVTSLWFMSIALFESGDYHQNVKNTEWWINKFNDNGFKIYHDFMNWWTLNEWVRQDEGPERRFHVIVGLQD